MKSKDLNLNRINNYGVFNLGEIHGDVVNKVAQAFEGRDEKNQQLLVHLQEKILILTNQIKEFEAQVDDPGGTLNRIAKLTEEVLSEKADKPIVERHLEIIQSAVSKVSSVISIVNTIRELINQLLP